MNVMTVKQLADDQGVTYEAMRRLLARHSAELEGHIHVKDRTRFLDEFAVEFLKKRRRESPIVTIVEDQGARIEELQAQIESLRARLMAAQEELSKAQAARIEALEDVVALQNEVKLSLQARLDYDQVTAEKEAAEQQLQEQTALRQKAELEAVEAKQLQEADQKQIEELQAEIGRFKPSIFGFYRKV